MKFWKSEDPRLKKEARILTWTVSALLAAYIVFSVVIAVLGRDSFFGFWGVLGLMGLSAVVLVPLLLTTAQFIRWRLTVKHGAEIPDRKLDKALTVTSFAGGMAALVIFLLTALLDIDFEYPWSDILISTQASHFFAAAMSLCLGTLLLNYVMQWVLRRAEKKQDETKRAATAKQVRVTAAVLAALILPAILLIPFEHGTYNDGGGSEYYKAGLYEIIDWNRGYAEGTMQLPDNFDPNEEQRARIYVFPFNCYEFNAKWDMKH